MIAVDQIDTIKETIAGNRMVLVYLGSVGCGVCNVIKPQVEKLLLNFPMIISTDVDMEKYPEASAAYSVFTMPAVLVYIDGREVVREARYINLQELSSKLERYYGMIF